MSDLEALLFDVDGTLAETEELHRRAFNQAFAAAGLPWHWSRALYAGLLQVTGGKERIRFFMARHDPPLPGGPLDDAAVAALHGDKTRYFCDLLAAGELPLRTGVRRLLEEARAAGLRLGIATTTTRENVDALLRTTLGEAAIGWFDVIAAGGVVENKKPSPEIYQHALEVLGLAPGACLAFEDSAHGLRAALDAGIATVVTPSAYTRGQDFGGASLVVDHLGEPGQPCRVLGGVVSGARLVDVALLRRVHAAAAGRA
jgi:HAD superfamily hydrolase (TIGR01509 family)